MAQIEDTSSWRELGTLGQHDMQVNMLNFVRVFLAAILGKLSKFSHGHFSYLLPPRRIICVKHPHVLKTSLLAMYLAFLTMKRPIGLKGRSIAAQSLNMHRSL